MIPIASSTSLSIAKTSQLLQTLLELKNRKSMDLPQQITKSMNLLLHAQQRFVKDIDTYLHENSIYDNEMDNGKKHEMEYVTVKTIVESNPEFLAVQDKYGRLPCHWAAMFATEYSNRYFKLYIDIGCRYNIGGEDSRGGLLVPNHCQSQNAFHYIEDPAMLEMLRQMNPPLFHIQDVQKYHLLHLVLLCYRNNLNMVKYFVELDPSCIYQRDDLNQLPIHLAVDWGYNKEGPDVVEYLIQTSISHSTLSESIGGLFMKMYEENDDDDYSVLSYFVDVQGMEISWDCIERALSKYKKSNNLPCILHQTIQYSPEYCSEVIKRFPTSVHVQDSRKNVNRLPIHVALEKGMKWSIELEYLIATSQEYLKDVDPVTKFPPFALAAMGTSCDLRVIYDLLHMHPEHLEMFEDRGGYKYIIP